MRRKTLSLLFSRRLSGDVSLADDAAEAAAAAARDLLRAGIRARREAAAFGGDASTSTTSTSTSTTSNKLASSLVEAHAASKGTPGGQDRFVRVLCDDFGTDRKELERAVEAFLSCRSSPSSSSSEAATAAAEERLRRASTPSYEAFWPAVAGVKGGLATLSELREVALKAPSFSTPSSSSSSSSSPRRRTALAASLARSLAPALAAGTSLVRILSEKERGGGEEKSGEERRTSSSSPSLSRRAAEVQRALHPVRSDEDWQKRLLPPRACFALVHERGFGGDVPLATVCSFSSDRIASEVSSVLPSSSASDDGSGGERPSPSTSSPSTPAPRSKSTSATLYALCSGHAGLSGLDVGRAAARGAAEALSLGLGGSDDGFSSSLPPAQRIATLSPLPGFLPWLRGASSLSKVEFLREEEEAIREAARGRNGDDALSLLLSALDGDGDGGDPSLPPRLLRPALLRLACRFLAHETVRRLPADPVARFHAANGAVLSRVCFAADDVDAVVGREDETTTTSSFSSPRARRVLRESAGIMVNYSYLWPCSEEPVAVPPARRRGGRGGSTPSTTARATTTKLRVSEGVARVLCCEGEPERWGLVD